MPVLSTLHRRAGQASRWFAVMVILVFCGEALGYVACLLADTLPPQPSAWAASLAVAIVVGAVATMLLDWLVLDAYRRLAGEADSLRRQAAATQQLELDLAHRTEQQRKLRHDIRGALSPVLLVADRLLGNADPGVKRSGEIMVRTVERATALLVDSGESEVSPRAGP